MKATEVLAQGEGDNSRWLSSNSSTGIDPLVATKDHSGHLSGCVCTVDVDCLPHDDSVQARIQRYGGNAVIRQLSNRIKYLLSICCSKDDSRMEEVQEDLSLAKSFVATKQQH
ncbi:hypothetical protein KKA24_01390 [Patescibacteria group bacterium]|nr:hypothetical protein [Patescibacteria group bacterium]